MDLAGIRIHINGIVQGVGFRPFIFNLATNLGLKGWVRNTSAGVDIEVDGTPQALDAFIHVLKNEPPPLARIDEISVDKRPINGFTLFEIMHSVAIESAFQPVSPDVCICPDCLRELFDPKDRRYRYPFINCTNCGPRFTIIEDIPYDRPKTTMASFTMCPDCQAEYQNPLDRRFHAQPIACPRCGPQVWLELKGGGKFIGDDALFETQGLLKAGKIVAIKGLGGFHLACDATNANAVAELRRRKLRVDKPFALMLPSTDSIEEHCYSNKAERELLDSRERPIVILMRKPGSAIAREVAPDQDTLGVMLPYTPLHYLIFAPHPLDPDAHPLPPLVMTSGNLVEEPIAFDNDEARLRLASLADGFLMHDRPIRTRSDDSVVRVLPLGTADKPDNALSKLYPLRRSRGYAPFPVRLPWDVSPILATGAELKNTFCLTRERYAFLSHHIGDMENYETLQSFEDGISHYESLFRVHPEAIAYDLHPDYLASRYALERSQRENIPSFGVQHHHAHIAACMVENGFDGKEQVLGVAFDGTGYGEDGKIWGGEFMLADYAASKRLAHLRYIPLPGGDQATKEPWRIALAWLAQCEIEWSTDLPPIQFAREKAHPAALQALYSILSTGVNAPLTSSMGRLFDAAAALAGVKQTVNYEAQAAIEFEALCDPEESGSYPFDYLQNSSELSDVSLIIDPSPLFKSIVADLRKGESLPAISARFHNGVAEMVRLVIGYLTAATHQYQVILSGGVWQNITLLQKTLTLLEKDGFNVHYHRLVPCNDGGLALGQAVVAAQRWRT
jgi:hydrogenase maturation protein HypF